MREAVDATIFALAAGGTNAAKLGLEDRPCLRLFAPLPVLRQVAHLRFQHRVDTHNQAYVGKYK